MTTLENANDENLAWHDVLGPDAGNWDEVKNSENMEGFMSQMGNMRSLLGNSIRIPSEEAGAEDWSAFNEKLTSKVPGLLKIPDLDDSDGRKALYDKLGRPEKHEGYDPVDDMPDLREVAHEAGLSKRQYEVMMKAAQGNQNEIMDMVKENTQKSQIELKNKWGEAYPQRTQAIQNLINQTEAPQALKDMVAKGSLNGEMSEWLYGIVKQFGGEEAIINDVTNQAMLDPGEAMEQADEIYKRMMNENLPPAEYERLMHKRIKLISAANVE